MSAGDPPSPVRLGVDFDNTLVCYDRAFARLAEERALWSGAQQPDAAAGPLKQRLRDHLRATGRQHVWTELQGVAYGSRIGEARPFEGALESLRACAQHGVKIYLVSHKTRVPYAGAAVDLRAAASAWLAENGFVGAGAPLSATDVFFESTREDKVARVAALGCTHFVDDLAEFLSEAALPRGLVRMLFDPSGAGMAGGARDGEWILVRSWDEVAGRLAGGAPRSAAAGAGRS